jgi:uncharacterized protein (TIGR02466 family)
MAKITPMFPTPVYRAELPDSAALNVALEAETLDMCLHDQKGIAWCEQHGYAGYTSYGSIPNLAEANKLFTRLSRQIVPHAKAFTKYLDWDLRGQKPLIDTLWVNLLPEGGSHTSHIHTNAVLSGTYYVNAPKGSSPIVFEDPRHTRMMAAPQRKNGSPYVSVTPRAGTLLIWESWLRHEVPVNRSQTERISVSFNCVIG